MELVIDAQVFKGYYQETVHEQPSDLTGEAALIFERLGSEDFLFFDDGGQIEQEWRSLVDWEWFDGWYPRLLADGVALEIRVDLCRDLLRTLGSYGFPTRRSRDPWYIRTAKTVSNNYGNSTLITEDLHFYEPSEGSARGDRRISILLSCSGRVARHLVGRENINIRCVAGYLENVCGEDA